MKTLFYLVAILVSVTSLRAETLHYHFFSFIGDLPSINELVRLHEQKQIFPLLSGSINLEQSSSFRDQRTEDHSYPVEFGNLGEVITTEDTLLGYVFSGKVKQFGEITEIQYEYYSNHRTGDQIFVGDSGVAVVQPIFSRVETSSQITFEKKDDWSLSGSSTLLLLAKVSEK